jgi:hypothetical protein
MGDKILYHTIQIMVPIDMISINDKGVLSVKKTLTKTGGISKVKGRTSIDIIPSNIDKAEIIDNGRQLNIESYKESQKQNKKLMNEMKNFSSQELKKTKKIKKIKKKPKLNLDDNLTKEIENIYKLNAKLQNEPLNLPKKKIKEATENILHFEPIKKIKYNPKKSKSLQADIEEKIKNYNNWVKYYNKLIEKDSPKNEHFYEVIKNTEDALKKVNKKLSLLNKCEY